MSKKIVPLNENARIVIEEQNYILQIRRRSKTSVPTWRTFGYFPDLRSLGEEYINGAPQRSENAIRNIQELIGTIRKAEKTIGQLFKKFIHNQTHS